MAETSTSDRVADLLNKLGISGQQLQNVKLGPGVVGRNTTIAWAFEIVMLAGVICSAVLHNALLLGISLSGAIVVALVIVVCNVYFGSKNPAAALLRGCAVLGIPPYTNDGYKGNACDRAIVASSPIPNITAWKR